jgi:hypothetical protein
MVDKNPPYLTAIQTPISLIQFGAFIARCFEGAPSKAGSHALTETHLADTACGRESGADTFKPRLLRDKDRHSECAIKCSCKGFFGNANLHDGLGLRVMIPVVTLAGIKP